MADPTPTPAFDAGRFRYLVARYIKLLIRARHQAEPGYISSSELASWGLTNIDQERLSTWHLLRAAADSLAVLNTDYLPVSDSGGIEAMDESTPLTRLMVEVAFFVEQPGGGPPHNQALLDAAARVKTGLPVDWPGLAAWDRLEVIRTDLDRLPHPGTDLVTKTSASPTDQPHVFRRAGSDWEVRFDGGERQLYRHSLGMLYLHALVERQGQPVSVHDLDADANRFAARPTTGGVDELLVHNRNNSGPVLDGRALRQLRQQLQESAREREVAARDRDTVRLDQLDEEMRELERHLSRATRPGGLPVNVGDDHKNVLDRITKAIRRAIRAIESRDPVAGRHFDAAVHTGGDCIYRPPSPVSWSV